MEITMTTILVVYNHDEGTTSSMTLEEFIKLFNKEYIDPASFTIESAIYNPNNGDNHDKTS